MTRKTKGNGRRGKPTAPENAALTPALGEDGIALVHPVAEMFPLMTGEAFEQFVADIQEHGQAEPGTLDADGRILDGRNRYRACQRLGIEMKWRLYDGPHGQEVAYILSKNVHRRDLTGDQKAAAAAEYASMRQGERT